MMIKRMEEEEGNKGDGVERTGRGRRIRGEREE
jgi:hypothetical protein